MIRGEHNYFISLKVEQHCCYFKEEKYSPKLKPQFSFKIGDKENPQSSNYLYLLPKQLNRNFPKGSWDYWREKEGMLALKLQSQKTTKYPLYKRGGFQSQNWPWIKRAKIRLKHCLHHDLYIMFNNSKGA